MQGLLYYVVWRVHCLVVYTREILTNEVMKRRSDVQPAGRSTHGCPICQYGEERWMRMLSVQYIELICHHIYTVGHYAISHKHYLDYLDCFGWVQFDVSCHYFSALMTRIIRY